MQSKRNHPFGRHKRLIHQFTHTLTDSILTTNPYFSNPIKIKKMKKHFKLLLFILIFLVANSSIKAQLQNPRNTEYDWKTDTTIKSVELSEIILVAPRNTFPSINYPAFIGKEKGLNLFFKHEPVISVSIDSEAKAYPLNMLTMHEMSNDSLGGIPILPTYCPLCNSSVVYDRRLKHNEKEYLLDFEVSGMLRNSAMVMADKQTETWWQQLTGIGLVGELSGAELEVIPSLVISVEEFFNRYPDGKILSPETGTKSEERYGTNPYENYDDESNKPWERFYNHTKLDPRLPPMERVIDVKGDNGYKIYPFSIIAKEGTINDSYDGKDIVIFYKEGTVSVLDNKEIEKSKAIGSATVFSSELDGNSLTFEKKNGEFIDKETGSVWDITGLCLQGQLKGKELWPEPHSNHFAFAWLTFHPESEIYGQ